MSGASLKTFPANTGVRCMLNEVMKGGEVILKKCRGKSWSFSEKAWGKSRLHLAYGVKEGYEVDRKIRTGRIQ